MPEDITGGNKVPAVKPVVEQGLDGADLNPGTTGGTFSSTKKTGAPGPAENPPADKPGWDGAALNPDAPAKI